MMTKNPHIEELHNLIRTSDESEESKKKIAELEAKSREYTQEMLQKLHGTIEHIAKQQNDVKRQCDSLRKQYMQMCVVYKDVIELVENVRIAKKQLREELYTKKYVINKRYKKT